MDDHSLGLASKSAAGAAEGAATRVMELLVRAGQDSMTHTLVELGRLMVMEDADISRETLAKSLSDHQEMFKKLVKMDFIQHGDPLITSPANHGVLDIAAQVMEDAKDALEDKQMFHVNQMKVKQVVRDRIIAEAAERRLCPESGKLMTSVLRLVDAEPGSNGNYDNHYNDDDTCHQVPVPISPTRR